jgi:hypothetical protein
MNDRQANMQRLAHAVTQSDFTDCVDRCVASLLARPATVSNESAQAQLRAWLADDQHALDDGRPIDFALFDSTILSVEERLPASGNDARTRLLNAARRLAETVYTEVASTRVVVAT